MLGENLDVACELVTDAPADTRCSLIPPITAMIACDLFSFRLG